MTSPRGRHDRWIFHQIFYDNYGDGPWPCMLEECNRIVVKNSDDTPQDKWMAIIHHVDF